MKLTVASARSAPGVTTAVLACATVWPGRVLVVEAAEDGGVVAARFGLALEPGLTTLAASLRRTSDPSVVREHTQSLPGTDGRVEVLVGPSSTEPAHAVWRSAGDTLAAFLHDMPDDTTVLVDAGRLPVQPVARATIGATDGLLLVVRPRLEDLQTVAARLPVLQQLGPPVQLLVVGSQPYGAEEIASTLHCPVVGVLADDRPAADALAGVASARRLDRGPLVRSAVTVVDQLRSGQLRQPDAAVAPPEPRARPFTAVRP